MQSSLSDRIRLVLVIAGLTFACADSSTAESLVWPTQTVRIIVGYPPGASPDTVARLLADPLSRALGKAVIVENKQGAAGNLGVDAVVRSSDGHTFGITTFGPLTTSKKLFKNLPYDPVKDVTPLSLAVTSPLVLVCDVNLPPISLKEFLTWAKGQPDGVTYGSIGVGTGSHLAMELFASRSGIKVVHVPYQGIPQVTTAILSHQVQAAFMPPSGALAQSKAGKLRMLAVSAPQRWPLMPDLPTVAESADLPDFKGELWIGAFGPATMPPAVAARLSAEIDTVLKQTEIHDQLLSQGWQVVGGGADVLRRRMANDTVLWGRVIQEAKVPTE